MRPIWDQYFIELARTASLRAECTRRMVGAILVKDQRVRGVGYNGALPGYPSCLDGACPRATAEGVIPGKDYSNCIADHAERNLLRNSNPNDAKDGDVYVNEPPCDYCVTLMRSAGVKVVIYPVAGQLMRLNLN